MAKNNIQQHKEIIKMKTLLVISRISVTLLLLAVIFPACSPDKPSEADIKSFLDNFPKPTAQWGSLTFQYLDAKIRNQWADENMKGVYYIEVEYEVRAHSSRYGDAGAKGILETYRFNRKGDKWEVERSPIKRDFLWSRATRGW
jgi:hypothetical protein